LRLVPPKKADHWAHIKSLTLDSLSSGHSRRVYLKALDDFQQWCAPFEAIGFNKAMVQHYRSTLEQRGLAPSS
jgi:hypothetical protein